MNGNPTSLPIAERDLLYETLRKAEERAIAGRLALEVMHEIRNPLEAIANLTYLASHGADDPEQVRSYMRLAEEQMATITRIANTTLAFARSSTCPERVNLASVTEAALRIHQGTIRSKNIEISRRFSESVQANAHTGEMLQVISNVIVNALDALPSKGKLFLRIKRSVGKIHILIADNGHGIPAERLPNIFQPFYTTKGQYGTGLGLAISKNILDRHRGHFQVRSSTVPGKSGTAFRISLPA